MDDEQLVYLLNRGESKYQAGDFWGAIDDFSNVIEHNDELPIPIPFFAHFGRGQAKLEIKDYAGAIDDYSEAIRLIGNGFGFSIRGIENSKNDIAMNKNQVHLSRANAKYAIKDYVGAIQDYSKAIELEIDNYQPYAGRGESRYEIKDYTGAISDFRKAIELNPHAAWYYDCCIKAYECLNDYEGVRKMKEKKAIVERR